MMAVALALAAVFSLLVPGTSSAAPVSEKDYAVKGTLPLAGLVCANQKDEVWVCYEQHGDRWWVRDNKQDEASALVRWTNYRNGSLYRTGDCINSHGAGTWAYCNKDYYEDSELFGRQCYWDRSEDPIPTCYSFGTEEKQYQ